MRVPPSTSGTATATVFNLTFSALTLDNQLLLTEHGLNGAEANSLVLGVLMLSGLPANIVAESIPSTVISSTAAESHDLK